MAHRILDSIESPDDLKLLTNEELSILAHEIREEIGAGHFKKRWPCCIESWRR